MADSEEVGAGGFYALAWTFYLFLALAGVLWIGFSQGQIHWSLFLDPQTWLRDALAGLAAGGALLLLWHGSRQVLPAARELEEQLRQVLGPLSMSEATALALISGFAEEILFRGALQGQVGWLWASLIFALMHLGPGWRPGLWTAFALVAGLAFSGLVEWSGNLLPAILAHMLVNVVNLRRLVREGVPDLPAS